MRYPRLLFAVLTIVICLLLDFTLRQMNPAAPAQPGPERMSSGFVTETPTASLPASPSTIMARAAIPETLPPRLIPSETPPIVNPPSFKAPDKPAGLLPPPPLTPPAAAAVAIIADASFSELPEPQANKTGLILLNFADASLFCSKQGKRLPSILEVAQWAAHNGALVASIEDAKQLKRDNEANAIYLQRGAKTQTVDFYFDRDRFAYPAARPITNAAVWTSDERPLGGLAKANHYAFSLYNANFSPVPDTSSLAVVCLDKNTTKGA